MFANMLKSWWVGGKAGDEVDGGKEEKVEEKMKKMKVVDEDGLTEDEEEVDDEEMKEIRRRFRAAEAYLPKVTDRLDKRLLLRMYGLFKTATVGKPVASSRPSMFDQKGRTKFDAWAREGNLTKKEAMRAYADALEAAGVNFDPTAMASTSGGGGGFGKGLSRPMGEPSSSSGDMHNGDGSTTLTPEETEWEQWLDAAKEDKLDVIKSILASNPGIMLKRDSAGMTGMHWAADSGSMLVCAHLLAVEPSLLVELDSEGNQPLHLAAIVGYIDLVPWLVAQGASPIVENYLKETPIDIAATPQLKQLLMDRADQMEDEAEAAAVAAAKAAAAAATAAGVAAAAATAAEPLAQASIGDEMADAVEEPMDHEEMEDEDEGVVTEDEMEEEGEGEEVEEEEEEKE